MHSLSIFALLQATSEDGLTFGEVLSNIPHDAAAIVVYVLVGFSVGLVVWSGRRRGPGKPPAGAQ